ncbi:MAG: hypothetical protein ACK45B_08355 [Limisphaerales bacterium]
MNTSHRRQTTPDPLMPAPARLMVVYWERVLNGLVYELYFPEEVHGAGLRLFDSVAQAILPVFPPNMEQTILSAHAEGKSKEDTDRIVCATLRQLFETLHDGAHPLRQALDKLATLETIRIIEGKE